jgi:hypothetical protein
VPIQEHSPPLANKYPISAEVSQPIATETQEPIPSYAQHSVPTKDTTSVPNDASTHDFTDASTAPTKAPDSDIPSPSTPGKRKKSFAKKRASKGVDVPAEYGSFIEFDEEYEKDPVLWEKLVKWGSVRYG